MNYILLVIRYYHFGCEKEDNFEDNKALTSRSMQNISESAEVSLTYIIEFLQLHYKYCLK